MSRIKTTVPGGRPLIDIGYKYNTRKVLYFIIKESVGITKADILYLSKYPEPFSNVSICPVACPLFMSKFFEYIYEVDPPKTSRPSDLEL